MTKERFVLGWRQETETSQDFNVYLSDRVKSVMDSPHGMWNYMTYRDAANILGVEPSELYKEGRIDLDQEKWADFGWMLCFAGPPASAVREMRKRTIASNINPYSPDLINPLREACAEIKFNRKRGEHFEVIGTEGGQAGVSYALQTLINPNDEVIITDPGYFHFESAILMARGVPVRIPLNSKNGYTLNPDEVREYITPRTKALIVCDPINPFGTVQLKEQLMALIETANEHNFFIINDITHNTQCIDQSYMHYPMSSLWKESNVDNVISVFSVSHGYGMAGVRIGFLGGHPEIMRACLITKVSMTRLNTNLIAQYGALAALHDEKFVKRSEKIIRRNYRYIKRAIGKIEGISIPVEPKYGFSMVMDVSNSGITAQELTVALFKHQVAVYPGDGLGDIGATDFIRLNISRPDIWAMRHLERVLPMALDEAKSGIYRKGIIQFFRNRNTNRARKILHKISELQLANRL